MFKVFLIFEFYDYFVFMFVYGYGDFGVEVIGKMFSRVGEVLWLGSSRFFFFLWFFVFFVEGYSFFCGVYGEVFCDDVVSYDFYGFGVWKIKNCMGVVV